MKLKALQDIFENGKVIKKGEVFETTPERAKALIGSVAEAVEKVKTVEKPPKDKMVHKAKRK